MPKMPLSAKTAVLMAGTALLLSACSSITDTPNQQVQFLTPGATGARCDIRNDYVHYVANPPEKVFMLRSRDAVTVTCEAPGNRSKTMVVYPKFNASATENLSTAGLGNVYDYFSGALYEYPNPVSVDFRGTQASNRDLPGYHAPDTVSPFDQQPEDMRDKPTLHPGESNLAPAPAPMKETDEDQEGEDSSDNDAKPQGSDKGSDKGSDTGSAAPTDTPQTGEKDLPIDGTDIGS